MTVANDALLINLGQNDFPVFDDLVASATTQNLATKCVSQVNRFIKVVASGAAVLPSLVSLEAPNMIFVINDDPSDALSVFPAPGETINALGVNAAFTGIAAGTSAIFIAVVAAKAAKGGGIVPGSFANNWRAAVIP